MISSKDENNNSCAGKTYTAFLISIAANIFLVAFILGRITMPGMMHHHMHHHGYGEYSEFRGGEHEGGFFHHQQMGEGGERMHGHLFGPSNIFSPEEMQQNSAKMQQNFDKMHALRVDFAKQLESGSITKEQVLKHFADVDSLMSDIKKQMQDKAADKIVAMTPEEKKQFADKLLAR